MSLDTYQIVETGAEIIKKIEEKSARQHGIRLLDDLVENTLVEDTLQKNNIYLPLYLIWLIIVYGYRSCGFACV